MNFFTQKQKDFLSILTIVLGIGISLFVFMQYQVANGALAISQPAISDQYRMYDLFASTTAPTTTLATTTTATSTNIVAYFDSAGRLIDGSVDLRGAKKAVFYFSRGDTSGQGNSGKTVFKVQTTRDGTNWNDFNQLIGNDLSATGTTTVTISAATSTVIVGMDLLKNAFFKARCISVETTDGEASCAVGVQY